MEKRFKGKKIGIWGFGLTGQSALTFLSSEQAQCMVFDDKSLSLNQTQLIKQHKALAVDACYKQQFFEANELILVSPGVSLESWFEKYPNKFISELDLFAQYVTTPVIAITGSAGKTSTVTLLNQALNACGKKTCVGGNIGTPLLNLLSQQHAYDYLILELSSFQLEHTTQFAPSIAAIINIFENHLDRHHIMSLYVEAKAHIFMQQQEHQQLIIPLEYIDAFWSYFTHQKTHLIAPDAYKDITHALSDITCHQNLQIICAILETLHIEPQQLLSYKKNLKRPEHRLEYVLTHDDITFYNDSKATMPAATLQALTQLQTHHLILMIGGLSKGVDRSLFIQQLVGNQAIKHIICFGTEALQLHTFCQNAHLASSAHTTLQKGYDAALTLAKSGDTILLSPAGSSYDEFKNYEERGTFFKKLCQKFKTV